MVTLKNNEVLSDVGVIVGRFQTDILTEGHQSIINFVRNRHKKVIIMLGIVGISPVPATKNNPLDYETRRLMINEMYPDIIISYVKDMKSDKKWSNQLDSKISDVLSPNETVTLYGSRDSFIPYYKGQFNTLELESDIYISATAIRKDISLKTRLSEDFRAGVIYGITHQFDMPQTTVDIAVYKVNSNNKIELLLGRKDYNTEFQFVGGFSSVESESFERDAIRETLEELGDIEIDRNLVYVGSYKINDWRYRSEKTKIKTIFYYTKYLYGKITPQDDIVEARWFELETLESKPDAFIVSGHLPLFADLIKRKENLC